jgi:ABC-type sulfate transport system substrate-binding protein
MTALRDGIDRFDGAQRAVILTGFGNMLTWENDALEPATMKDISPALGRELPEVYRLRGRPVFFVYELSKEEGRHLQSEGYALYIFSEQAPTLAINMHGYDPYELCSRLEILNDRAFYRVPTASR